MFRRIGTTLVVSRALQHNSIVIGGGRQLSIIASSMHGTSPSLWQQCRSRQLSESSSSTNFSQQRRNLSFFGRLTDMATGNTPEAKKKQFDEMMASLLNTDTITLRMIRDMLKGQLNTFAAKIPGNSQVAQLKKYVVVMDKMSNEQLDDPTKLSASEKIKLATEAEAAVKDIDAIVTMYTQTKISSTWLKYKQYKGEELPESQGELMDMQTFDKRLKFIASELIGAKNLPYKGKKYTKFLDEIKKSS